ncbi:MAG: Gldg family protein [Deltaproteobacteria bacterium]|nr:Gldg family protein [Deltaproteobacteria bacterium]
MTPASWAALTAFLLLFLGERTFAGSPSIRLTLDGLAVVLLLAAVVLRWQALRGATRAARVAHRNAFVFLLVAVAGAVVYGLTTGVVLDRLPLGDTGKERWDVILTVLWPILVAAGLVPSVALDRAIVASPVAAHPRRVADARDGALAAVLALCMLFPLNWLAHEFNHRWDVTYFRTTSPGTATQDLVANLQDPLRVVLFFPEANEVAREVVPYFDALSGPNLSVEVVDQALEPETAKDLKIRENGHIVFVVADRNEKIKIGTDIDRAKKTLKTFDAEVQKAMLKLAKGKRVAYFTSGHGEMAWRGTETADRKISLLKKVLEEALNFQVQSLGLGEGLASDVPDDATIVFVMGPKSSFLPEEAASLDRYRLRGGSLFAAFDPDIEEGADFGPLLAPYGLAFRATRLGTDDRKAFVPITGGVLDRQNLVTNRYSSHESVTTLTKNRSSAWVVLPGAGSLEELPEHGGKVTVTLRTPEVWEDLDGDFEFDEDHEEKKVRDVAAVASGPANDGKEYRAVVLSEAGFASDALLAFMRFGAPAQLVADAVNWLLRDEGVAGSTSNEEDVKIVHTKEGQGIWFYASTFLVPLALGLLGWFRVRTRRKKGVA